MTNFVCDLRARVLLTLMVLLSSRFHLTTGSGEPEAAQDSVTLAFSRTITSEELWVSDILGGTAGQDGHTCIHGVNNPASRGVKQSQGMKKTSLNK